MPLLRIGVVAGEASGDMLGARVLAAMRSRYPDLKIEGIGGPLMQELGLASMFPMERLAVMGLVEPLKRLPELLGIRRALFRHFSANPPDLFLGIDSPDFNLPLERRLRQCGTRTAHLVSPAIWAWRKSRIHNIKRSVDLMLCLFPFETAIYRQHGVQVVFVGHPLADEIPLQVDRDAARAELQLPGAGKLLALLPGSRAGEVKLLTPLFLQAASALSRADPQLSFVMPCANAARQAELAQLLTAWPDLPLTLLRGRSRQAMAAADAVLAASGTATLEAALLKRPMVVAYRMGASSWWLVSRLVTTPYAALPNVLADMPLVPELLQREATAEAMAAAVAPLLAVDPKGGNAAAGQLQAFDAIHRQLRQGYAGRAAAALAALADPRSGECDGRPVSA